MANIPSLPGELPFPLGLLAFGSGVMLTAPNLAPKDSELVRREIQEIREALEALNAARIMAIVVSRLPSFDSFGIK
jgi:hypothetical protein